MASFEPPPRRTIPENAARIIESIQSPQFRSRLLTTLALGGWKLATPEREPSAEPIQTVPQQIDPLLIPRVPQLSPPQKQHSPAYDSPQLDNSPSPDQHQQHRNQQPPPPHSPSIPPFSSKHSSQNSPELPSPSHRQQYTPHRRSQRPISPHQSPLPRKQRSSSSNLPHVEDEVTLLGCTLLI